MENDNIRENDNLNKEITEIEETTVEADEEMIDEAADEPVDEAVEEYEEAAEENSIGDEWQQYGAAEEAEMPEDAYEEPLSEEELATKRKKTNRIIAICAALAVVIAFALYWVCSVEGIGSNTVVSTALLDEEGKDALKDNIRYENPVMAIVNSFNANKDAVMTVDGAAVTPGVFEYVLNSAGTNCVISLLQTNLISDVSEFDWNENAFGTELSYLEYAKGMAIENIIPTYGLIAAGEKNGIYYDDEDEKRIKEGVDGLKEQYGEDFEDALHQNGYPDEETFINLQRIQLHADKVYTDAMQNLDKYITQAELAKNQEQEQVTVKHILIAFDEEGTGDVTDEKKAAALKEAEEVLEKLEAGEDFDWLMEQYNDDPGATTDGYTFADDGTMVQQFTDASFALNIGETSGLVETSYGYHIIRRMELKYTVNDYIKYLMKNTDVRIRKANFSDADITIDLEAELGASTVE